MLHDYHAWRETGLVYADWLEDEGQIAEAARRRQYVARKLPPGLLWPAPRLVAGITAHQRERLAEALRGPVGVLAGSPGTGKTFVLAELVKAIPTRRRDGYHVSVALCAPTGKAAVRISEAMARAGWALQATTIHQLLGIGRNGHDGQGWDFRHNEGNPLGYQYVIVDEASMLDTTLADCLFRALRPGAHVLLVGDPDQLPPVGHGAVLRDLIRAGLPCGRLTEIQRNAGAIVEGCAAIREGRKFRVARTPAERDADNLWLTEAKTPQDQVAKLLELLTAMGELGINLTQDLQVLVATNKGSPVSRLEVNRLLQDRLNQRDPACTPGDLVYRINDKVICLRNHLAGSADARGQCWLANGEIGTVTAIEGRAVMATFPAPDREVLVPAPRPKGEGDGRSEEVGRGGGGTDFDLAYAITAHKSQGSEWPVVVVLVDPSYKAKLICTREWIYTAISRAKKLCVLIGQEGILRVQCRRTALDNRKTFLSELLREK